MNFCMFWLGKTKRSRITATRRRNQKFRAIVVSQTTINPSWEAESEGRTCKSHGGSSWSHRLNKLWQKRCTCCCLLPSPEPHFDTCYTLQPICSRRQKGDEKLEHPAARVLLPKEVLRNNTYARFKKKLFDVWVLLFTCEDKTNTTINPKPMSTIISGINHHVLTYEDKTDNITLDLKPISTISGWWYCSSCVIILS